MKLGQQKDNIINNIIYKKQGYQGYARKKLERTFSKDLRRKGKQGFRGFKENEGFVDLKNGILKEN